MRLSVTGIRLLGNRSGLDRAVEAMLRWRTEQTSRTARWLACERLIPVMLRLMGALVLMRSQCFLGFLIVSKPESFYHRRITRGKSLRTRARHRLSPLSNMITIRLSLAILAVAATLIVFSRCVVPRNARRNFVAVLNESGAFIHVR
jgi:hypothetical protein